ncbi:hypothetical protein CMO91_03100 [Candidatus Woesearchaeota archaeon]|nr:hypothetical protein [Candidatus Woesearchaeota archaeon]|tara:strand:+ start:214 stop:624 length:411 start_codon:yes stop_codon:yes gene_type:complete
MKQLMAVFGIIAIASMGLLFVTISETEGKFVYWDTYRRAPGGQNVNQVGTPYYGIDNRDSYKYIYKDLQAKGEIGEVAPSSFQPYTYKGARLQKRSEYVQRMSGIERGSTFTQRRLGSGEWYPPPESSATRRLTTR